MLFCRNFSDEFSKHQPQTQKPNNVSTFRAHLVTYSLKDDPEEVAKDTVLAVTTVATDGEGETVVGVIDNGVSR